MLATKINSLTKEQEALFSVYRDKWLAIGLSTESANRKEAEIGIEEAYKIAGLNKPKIVWCLSPLSNALTRYCVFKIIDLSKDINIKASVGNSVWDSVVDSVRNSVGNSVRASVGNSVWDSVRASVGNSVGASVGNSVRDSVWASVRDSVRASVGDSVWDSVRASVRASVGNSVGDSVWDSVVDSVWASVWDSVWASVWDSVGNSVGASVWDSVWDSGYGQHEAASLGFYDYFNNVLKLEKQTEKLKGLWIIAKNAGWYIPHKNICWISERHNICNLKDGRIHCDCGPAIAYPDGFKIWALNGVRVPEYLVMTPEGKLDIEFFKKETNAEIRAQFVRKYGIERMKSLGSVKEKKNDYELIDMAPIFTRVSYAPYLLMKNPSTGTMHMEGVHPDCKTIEASLNWRNGNEGKPFILT